jgi:hypothetical protein
MPSNDVMRTLSMVLTGSSKAGKTTLAATAPQPVLVIDVENGSRFLQRKKIYWDPTREEVPVYDGTWEVCIAITQTYLTAEKVHKILVSGKHPFKSVVVDSISEYQMKVVDSVTGRQAPTMQQWGEVYYQTNGFLYDMRNLVMDPANPLQVLVFIAMERQDSSSMKMIPMLQGRAGTTLPYVVDVSAYLAVEEFPYPDQVANPGTYSVRRLYVGPNPKYATGERVGGALGEIVEQADLDITMMLEKLYGPLQPDGPADKGAKAQKGGTK